MYNCTSIVQTDFQTDFNRLLSVIMFYDQYTIPEDIDEIGQRVLKEYFPSGALDNDTHSNAVNVCITLEYKHKKLDHAYHI